MKAMKALRINENSVCGIMLILIREVKILLEEKSLRDLNGLTKEHECPRPFGDWSCSRGVEHRGENSNSEIRHTPERSRARSNTREQTPNAEIFWSMTDFSFVFLTTRQRDKKVHKLKERVKSLSTHLFEILYIISHNISHTVLH